MRASAITFEYVGYERDPGELVSTPGQRVVIAPSTTAFSTLPTSSHQRLNPHTAFDVARRQAAFRLRQFLGSILPMGILHLVGTNFPPFASFKLQTRISGLPVNI